MTQKCYAWRDAAISGPRGHLAALCTGDFRGPTVVVCHGFSGTKEGSGLAMPMAEALRDRGYSCVLFDFTRCGESSGSPGDITLPGQVEDLKAVVDFVGLEGTCPVVVVGRSLGAATAICEAASDPRVTGVCA